MDADRSHIIPFELFVLAVLLYRNSLVRIFNIDINVHYEILYLRHCYCNKTPHKKQWPHPFILKARMAREHQWQTQPSPQGREERRLEELALLVRNRIKHVVSKVAVRPWS
jgi:hypothetical protein